MQVLPTTYNGIKFRSRLEARWALYLDLLGYKWYYEYEGYDLGEHGCYLPDFYIMHKNNPFFIEVKPDGFTEDPRHIKLSETSRYPLYVAIGYPTPDNGYLIFSDGNILKEVVLVDASHKFSPFYYGNACDNTDYFDVNFYASTKVQKHQFS